ncbi:MAG: hypothetical protein AB1498_05975, partial [bacterium]
ILIIFNQTWHYTLAKKKNRPLFLCGSFRFFCDFLGFNCQSSVNLDILFLGFLYAINKMAED